MAEQTPSLWSYGSPEAYRIAQQAAIQKAASEYAQKTQQQRTDEAGYMAGASLRGGLNSLFGVEDQGLQQVKQFQEIMRDVDRQDHNSIFAAAKKLQDINHPAFDYVVKVGEKVKKDQAELAKTAAETENQKAQAGRATADAAEKYNSMLTATEKKANRIKALKELGIPENQIEGIASDDKTFESYLKRAGTTITEADGQVLMVDDRTGKVIKTLGKAPERGTRVNVDASTKQEGAFAVERGKLQAKSLSEWEAARDASSAVVPKIDSMIASNNAGQLYTGPQAPVTKTFANLLNSANLLSPKAQEQLTKSEVYDKYAKDLVFAEMEGKLGTGVSNADREYIEARVPQLSTSPKARSELLSKFKELHQKRIDKANAAVKHANKYGNLNEFNLESSPKPSVIKLD